MEALHIVSLEFCKFMYDNIAPARLKERVHYKKYLLRFLKKDHTLKKPNLYMEVIGFTPLIWSHLLYLEAICET